MKKILFYIFLFTTYLLGHCQVPCGIYDDSRIILEIEQHIQTIEKAMLEIETISNSENSSPQNNNQLIRWINTKEQHAQLIQNTISNYFLSQRIKPKNIDEANYNNYVDLTTTCQKIIFTSMKTKQHVDLKFIIQLRELLDFFSYLYFDEHGLNHLMQLKTK